MYETFYDQNMSSNLAESEDYHDYLRPKLCEYSFFEFIDLVLPHANLKMYIKYYF